MVRKTFLTAVLAGACLASVAASLASAADIPSAPRVYRQAPVYSPAPTWAGDYIGIWGSYNTGRVSFWDSVAGGDSFGQHGGLGGLSYAHYWQLGNFVIGPKVTYGWGSISGSKTYVCGPGCSNIVSNTVTSLGTAGLDLGYAFGSFLPHIGGGFAVGHTKTDFRTVITPILDFTSRFKETGTGYYVEAGLGYKITENLVADVSYRRTELNLPSTSDSLNFSASQKVVDNAVVGTLAWRFSSLFGN